MMELESHYENQHGNNQFWKETWKDVKATKSNMMRKRIFIQPQSSSSQNTYYLQINVYKILNYLKPTGNGLEVWGWT